MTDFIKFIRKFRSLSKIDLLRSAEKKNKEEIYLKYTFLLDKIFIERYTK